MRKAASIFSIVLGIVVLTASNSRSIMERITKFREEAPKDAWWATRPWVNGDLVRMGYLEGVSRFTENNEHHFTRAGAGKANTDLYIYGDSYVKDIPDSAFYGLHAYHFGRRDYTELTYRLDTTRTNILIIAFGERFIRQSFARAENIFDHVYKAKDSTQAALFALPQAHTTAYASFDPAIFIKDLFNPHINQNIEYNIFSYRLLSPIPAFKAEMNATLFHRGSGDVTVSDDGSRLFLKSTLATSGKESAVEPIAESERAKLITQINRIYDHYRSEGFTEVYLTVPPNPVSLLQPADYNHLLPDIQNSRKSGLLKMPVIDVYESIKQTGDPAAYYLRGDTHWNDKGVQLWIGKVNSMLHSWEGDTTARRTWW